jgi:hypothetical protein
MKPGLYVLKLSKWGQIQRLYYTVKSYLFTTRKQRQEIREFVGRLSDAMQEKR